MGLSTTGLIDGVVACYLLLALLAVLLARQAPLPSPAPSGSTLSGPLLLAGYLAGSAAACKYPAMLFVVLPLTIWVALPVLKPREKGTGTFCRDQPSVGARPSGASHKRCLSPFPARQPAPPPPRAAKGQRQGRDFAARGGETRAGRLVATRRLEAGRHLLAGRWRWGAACGSGRIGCSRATRPIRCCMKCSTATWTPEKNAQWNHVHRPHDFSLEALGTDAAAGAALQRVAQSVGRAAGRAGLFGASPAAYGGRIGRAVCRGDCGLVAPDPSHRPLLAAGPAAVGPVGRSRRGLEPRPAVAAGAGRAALVRSSGLLGGRRVCGGGRLPLLRALGMAPPRSRAACRHRPGSSISTRIGRS